MLTADEVIAAVRVHADRVHDAVRRLGCGPQAATEVVERSALALIDAVSRQPDSVGDPVGWWFAKARALGRQVAGGDGDLPLGGGVLSSDANQVRLAEALEGRPERERAALLLRDSYDLPPSAVGTALGLDAQGAMEVVGSARLALLPTLTGATVQLPTDHTPDIAALARLGEGGAQAVRDATTRRHVRSCERCAEVLSAQERARRVLTGLSVVALPDDERTAILARVESRARAQLPASEVAPLLDEWEDDEEFGRRVPLSLLALGVVLAVGAGIGIGLLTSRGSPISPTSDINRIPLVTAAPVLSVLRSPAPTPTGTPSPTVSPSPRVFIITPSPTPTPTVSATPSATPTATQEPLTLSLSPSSGPNDTDITVSGTGWIPGSTVTVQYMNSVGGQAGSTATAVADEQGRFTLVLPAHDDQGVPGQHQVKAQDGTNFQQATFTATS